MIEEKIINIDISKNVIGQPIYLTEYVLQSEVDKDSFIYIQGGIHGGEVTLNIIKKVYDYAKKYLIKGKIKFIPFANPLSWEQKIYSYTTGKYSYQNGEDFNRTFGKKNYNVNCAIANTILKECEGATFGIDLHTAMNSAPHTIFSDIKYAKYACLLGIKFNNYCPPLDIYENTFDIQLSKKNIDNIVIECGAHDCVDDEKDEKIANGIICILEYLGFLEQKHTLNNKMQFFENTISYSAPASGIVRFNKQPFDIVKKGDLLFTVITGDLQDNQYKVYSNDDGIIFRIGNTHIYTEFSEVVRLVSFADMQDFELKR